jgi:ABC-type multidrug transport system fused ATPase/permease subunit
MLSIMSVGLFVVDPGIALVTFLLFFGVAFLLYRLLQVRARELGLEINSLTVRNNEKILEVLHSFRETIVRNRQQFYSEEIRKLRYALGGLSAKQNFQPLISKYVIESASVIGTLALAGYEFGTKNAVHAIAVLSVFMAASSRIAPAALRIQQGILTIRGNSGAANSTFSLIEELKNMPKNFEEIKNPKFDYPDFNPDIDVSSVKFQYSPASEFVLEKIDLHIKAGTSAAIVGPSGAGKTTLIDLILGVLEPQEGYVHISGMKPAEASSRWAGAISYVPQNVVISSGTIRDNVSLGFPHELAGDNLVWKALDLSQMRVAVTALPQGLDTSVGESGSRISGGQRQRLGIARALFTQPKLLVLDEATSALDGQTEADIGAAIANLSGKVTVVVVAHRLSTVRSVDQVIYIDKGAVVARGTFDEVRRKVPNFDNQATLMGL